LDFIYVPTADVDSTVDHYVDVLGADFRWKVRGMGTVVAVSECFLLHRFLPDGH